MEKRLTGKIEEYFEDFRKNIKTKIDSLNINNNIKSDILNFIYEYNKLSLEKDDFSKRKRIKSFVPQYLRCHAKRANGEQCTRKKKDNSCYCGTHLKNRPHGEIDNTHNDLNLIKCEVWMQDINGILYYIDKYNNIYNTEDILSNCIKPKVIAKYIITNDNQYIITEK